jgi:hypothetical protein
MTKNWVVRNKKSIIRSAFLVPIFSVAAVSISHVVSWYDLANPINWAIYLSIAVEIAAMSAIAASSVKVKGFSIWFVFIIVTLIQLIGNIFFSYSEININSQQFKDWAELTSPIFSSFGEDISNVSQRRLLALLEGGLLPLISLTCLHFFIQYGEIDNIEQVTPDEDVDTYNDSIIEEEIVSLDDTIINSEEDLVKPSNESVSSIIKRRVNEPSVKMKKIHNK